ncbi:hypothetical protein MMC09_004320 [Bachmanniomyces sp. S44760]|nr:hypothetical protein [Bachmanniomyces sp. S44760]
MALAHNLLLRSLNAIYLQATGVKLSADITDLLIMCQIWWETVHHHHRMEEEYFFPMIEEYTGEKNIMDTNIHQHAAFQAGVERFRVYVFQTTPETYDGKIVMEIIESFGPILTKHLTEEIESLLALDKFGGDMLEKSYRELDAKILASITEKVVFFFHFSQLSEEERKGETETEMENHTNRALASYVAIRPWFERYDL